MYQRRSLVLRLLAIVGIFGGSMALNGRLGLQMASAADISTDHVLVATLLGAAEGDGAGTPNKGDPDGHGTAIIDIEPQSGSVCFVLRVTGIATASAAHIHLGGPATNGPVQITLTAPNAAGFSEGCVIASPDTVSALLAAPSGFYVNIHNEDFTGGAMRGQLGHTTLTTTLSGAAEVNGSGEPNQGDPDGSGTATITVDQSGSQVCYVLRAAAITLPAAAAHIHEARAGTTGDVVVPLSPPNAEGVATGCVEGTIEVINGLPRTPSDYYVNVHTSDFSAGAVRGQLAGTVFVTSLTGAAEISQIGAPGAGDADGSGTAALVVDAARGDICYVLRVADIGLPAAAAHIHEAPAGANGGVEIPLEAPTEPEATSGSGVASDCVAVSAELIADLLETPANHYVNIHNAEFTGGALRGQLAGTVFTTTLTGESEVDGTGTPNQGDLDGTGTAVITLDAEHGDVCFVLRVADIGLPASAAHIHEAPAGVNGGVVVPLGAPNAQGLAIGCVAASAEQIDEILATPTEYYVNIHNQEFKDGALRGQLAESEQVQSVVYLPMIMH